MTANLRSFSLLIALCSSATGMAADYPDRPIRLIVPQAAGSATDNIARLLAAAFTPPGHVGGELFKYMTGTQIVHVPYKGGAMAINDLIAGHVHLMFESLNSIAPHARSGKVRALAVSGARRSPGFPDLPTVAQAAEVVRRSGAKID